MDVSRDQLMIPDGKQVRLPTPQDAHQGTTYTDDRWSFTIDKDQVVEVTDRMHRGDNAEPIVADQTGFLSFVARIMTAVYPSDVESQKHFTVVIQDDRKVNQTFTQLLQLLRRDHDSLYRLFHCLLLGYAASDGISAYMSEVPTRSHEQIISKFMERSNEFFDFSDIHTFLSSFDLAIDRIEKEIRRMSGEGTLYVEVEQ